MINCQNTTIICIDLQEKLVNMLLEPATISKKAVKLISAANILEIDIIITEQYPKGLGATIQDITTIADFQYIEKTSFSAFQTREFSNNLKENIVIFGIETHICVYQTVMDLIKKGHKVYVVADCCASREEFNHKISLELMKQEGARITSLEIILFEFLKTSKHPNFKKIQALIK